MEGSSIRIYHISSELKTPQNKTGVATILHQVTLNIKKINNQGNYIMHKGILDNKIMSIFNIHATKSIISKYLKEKQQGEIDSKGVILGICNVPLLSLNKSSKKNKQERRI